MAILGMFGAEAGIFTEAGGNTTTTGGTNEMSTAQKHTGSYSFRSYVTGTLTGTAFFTFNESDKTNFSVADVHITAYIYLAVLPSANDEPIMRFINTSGFQMAELRVTSAGALHWYDKDAGTGTTGEVGDDSNNGYPERVLSTGQWYRIEASCATGSTGAYEVRVATGPDDASTQWLSGTAAHTTLNCRSIQVGKPQSRNDKELDIYIDDVVIDDADFTGYNKQEALAPTASGSHSDFGGSYATIDEIPFGSGDYYTTDGTIDNDETYNCESAASAGISGTIRGVKIGVSHRAKTAGTEGAIKAMIRSGSTDDVSDAIANTAAVQNAFRQWLTDPSTSSAWTTSGIDGLEIGVREADTDMTNIHCVHGFVCFTPAAAGTSIPKFMHHYKQMMGAN